eukprot:346325_1
MTQNIIPVTVNIRGGYGCYDIKNDILMMNWCYSTHQKMEHMLTQIEKHVNNKYYPRKLIVSKINSKSFTGETVPKDIINKSITNYTKHDIVRKGLHITVFQPKYEHKIISEYVTCPYINASNNNNQLNCSVYYRMKKCKEFTRENLNHFNEYSHEIDTFNDKYICEFQGECKHYINVMHGKQTISDECHMKLYRHPPRTRTVKLSETVNSFICNKYKAQNHRRFEPDQNKYYNDELDGYLYPLIYEVQKNGFASDLCLECGVNDTCTHNDYSILQIVNDKMNHIRHKTVGKPLNRAEMLALILYTGAECNYDLCKSQRNGDYNKWKWFDYCLFDAIYKLSVGECGNFSVYSGLSEVQLNTNFARNCYFVTYFSTSWNKSIAKRFIGSDNGMIIKIDKEFKNSSSVYCCDVSWISRFPDECEILFARSINWLFEGNNFKCSIK